MVVCNSRTRLKEDRISESLDLVLSSAGDGGDGGVACVIFLEHLAKGVEMR